MKDSCDVVVVGAGFAGITAARDLTQAGLSVVVVEARDRIGGRTYTDDAIGRPVELGGAYVHWTQPNLWREMQRHGLTLSTPLPIERVHYLADGVRHSCTEAEFDAVSGPAMDQFFADARDHFPFPFDGSAKDIGDIDLETVGDRLKGLELGPADRDVLDGILSYAVADYDQQGVAQFLHWAAIYFGNWRALWESGAYWRIANGTKGLIEAIADESAAEVRLSTPVSAIEDTGDGVVVTTRASEVIRARAVIVAAPVNALSTIEFSPPLREATRHLIDDGHPMMGRKMWVRVKGEIEPFSASAPLGANPITIAMTEYRVDGDSLVVCFCPDAKAIDPADKVAVQAALRAYVPDIEVIDTAGHDWADDEFTQGTWMMMRPGQMSTVIADIQKPHGRIHFAGSDIAPLFMGWIEGALESGALTAHRVVESLQAGASPA